MLDFRLVLVLVDVKYHLVTIYFTAKLTMAEQVYAGKNSQNNPIVTKVHGDC